MEKKEPQPRDHYGLYPFDFIPGCIKEESLLKWPVFEKFRSAVDQANEFLLKNPHLAVLSAESIDFRWRNGALKDLVQSEFTLQEDHIKPYVTGLRVWTQPRADNFDKLQRIGYVTVVPKTDLSSSSTSLTELTDYFNEFLKKYPLPGRILNIQTLQIVNKGGEIDFDDSSWTVNGITTNVYITVFRIYYLHAEQVPLQQIGFADFFPQMLKEGGMLSYPKIEAFPAVFERVNGWINQLPSNVRLLNLQTIQTRASKDLSNRAYSLFYEANLFHEYQLRFIRAVYLINVDEVHVAPPSYFQQKLSSIVLTPAMLKDPGFLRNGTFDTPDLFKDHIHTFVKSLRLHVVSVETFKFKVWSGSEKKEGTDAMYTWHTWEQKDKNTWGAQREQYVNGVRVYFHGELTEEDFKRISEARRNLRYLPDYWHDRAQSSCSLM